MLEDASGLLVILGLFMHHSTQKHKVDDLGTPVFTELRLNLFLVTHGPQIMT
jgi:hypothetical protein